MPNHIEGRSHAARDFGRCRYYLWPDVRWISFSSRHIRCRSGSRVRENTELAESEARLSGSAVGPQKIPDAEKLSLRED